MTNTLKSNEILKINNSSNELYDLSLREQRKMSKVSTAGQRLLDINPLGIYLYRIEQQVVLKEYINTDEFNESVTLYYHFMAPRTSLSKKFASSTKPVEQIIEQFSQYADKTLICGWPKVTTSEILDIDSTGHLARLEIVSLCIEGIAPYCVDDAVLAVEQSISALTKPSK